MGASQSKPDDDKMFYSDSPIEFSQAVVDQLADQQASPQTSPARQNTLDAHVRAKIKAELENLKRDEDHVRAEIEQALEKENLDRESSMTGGDHAEEPGQVKHSATLLGDLEEVQKKVDRFQARRELVDLPSVKADGEAVVHCYKANPTTPLNCWQEVSKFKASVRQAEQEYFKSLPSS